MKLHFETGIEFQNFFSQLASASMPSFMPVEGAAGDGGFDGIEGTTAFQAYFPEPQNRKASDFIEKINKDLPKAKETATKLSLTITKWILVIPIDLPIKVIAHLQIKSKETETDCSYWGATKLLELVTKYPHIQDSFPTIFLPPVSEGIKKIQKTLEKDTSPRVLTSVEIVPDNEYNKQRWEIKWDYDSKMTNLVRDYRGVVAGGNLDEKSTEYQKEYYEKLGNLESKREASEKAYKLELEEINEYFDEEIEKVNEEMDRRGLFSSGIKDRALGKLEIKRNREIEKLKLKYGKGMGLFIAD